VTVVEGDVGDGCLSAQASNGASCAAGTHWQRTWQSRS
jgi:hypothetical protein